ncbi:hypothetical protein K1X76_03075 [bacterium]|nr:hypothetical protein [bacterium]
MKIAITLDITKPHTKYLWVSYTLHLGADLDEKLILNFPTWSPGSYLIREYQSAVDQLSVVNEQGKSLPHSKINKSQWEIVLKKSKTIKLNYRVYANDLNVRGVYADHEMVFAHLVAALFYPDGKLSTPVTLTVKTPPHWKVAIGKSGKNTCSFEHFDEVYDTPLLASPHLVFEKFSIPGTKYTLAFFGNFCGKTKQIAEDVKKIVIVQKKIFGENPCPHYLFQILSIKDSYGGLEHSFSSTNIYDGSRIDDNKEYKRLLGLLSHEHFHLWNVKRIRPRSLGPFDYMRENYTHDLWIAEGITSFYDDHTMLRAGLLTPKEYFEILADNLTRLLSNKASQTHSLSDSSFDAWIKYYRPNENTHNTVVSYYIKGSFIGLMLDTLLLKKSGGKKSLDDVMRELYKLYKKRPSLGFTREEFIESLHKLKVVNINNFLKNYVDGTTAINWQKIFADIGVKLLPKKEGSKYYLGLLTENIGNLLGIRIIQEDSPAYNSPLQAKDILIGINGQFIQNADQIDKHLSKNSARVLFARRDKLHEAVISLDNRKNFPSKLEISTTMSPAIKKAYKAFMRL